MRLAEDDGRPDRRWHGSRTMPSAGLVAVPASHPWLPPRGGHTRCRDLNHDFKELCRHNRDGSYTTQADRAHILDLIADQLHGMGFAGLRPRAPAQHVEISSHAGLAEELSPGTIRTDGQLRWARRRSARLTSWRAPMPRMASRIGCTSPTSPKQSSLAGNSSDHPHPLCPMSLRLQAPSACAVKTRSRCPRVGRPGRHSGTQGFLDKGGRDMDSDRTAEQRRSWTRPRRSPTQEPVESGQATYGDQLHRFGYQCGRAGIHAVHGHRHRTPRNATRT